MDSTIDDFQWINVDCTRITLEDSSRAEIHAFKVGRYPVTIGQFCQFCEATGYISVAERSESKQTYRNNQMLAKIARMSEKSRARQGLLERYRHPAHIEASFLSHQDAVAFCEWAGVELPTEQQWLAASIKDWEREYEDGFDAMRELGNTSNAIKAVGIEWTSTVGSKIELTSMLPPADLELLGKFRAKADVWAVLRSGPKYILPKGWQAEPMSFAAPTNYFSKWTSFRVCQ